MVSIDVVVRCITLVLQFATAHQAPSQITWLSLLTLYFAVVVVVVVENKAVVEM
jgi:hypothetical protein